MTNYRGERGDSGQTGSAGERGDSGHPGIAGERGPKGDHGQHGEVGEAGAPGRTGDTGKTGLTGKTEPSTIWFGLNRWTWAGIAFLLIVAMGVWSTWQTERRFNEQVVRIEMLVKQIEQESINTDYRTCLGGNKIRNGIRNVITTAYEEGPRRDEALSQFILRDCDVEFPTRTKENP